MWEGGWWGQGINTVCFDLSNIPADRAVGNLHDCVQVQYPGVIQMDPTLTTGGSLLEGTTLGVRVKNVVWSYANIVVTRTGGSDLGVTPLSPRALTFSLSCRCVGRLAIAPRL